MKKKTLPVDVRRSKTSLLKFTINPQSREMLQTFQTSTQSSDIKVTRYESADVYLKKTIEGSIQSHHGNYPNKM